MRTTMRLMAATMATAALLGVGSTAFAAGGGGGGDEDNDHSVTTAAAQGGNGGHGGDGGLGVNLCPAVGILGEASAECSAADGGSADGGDAEATAEDDSKDEKKGSRG